MTKILLTAFAPYDDWSENGSWLALVELTKDLPPVPEVTTRLYPVDFEAARPLVEADAAAGYDVILHLGQAPGWSEIHLEAVAVNIARRGGVDFGADGELVGGAPLAYRSSLPLDDWAAALRDFGLPAKVSFHAGTFLCNASLYWSLHTIASYGLSTQAAFLHIPLATSQVAKNEKPLASLPSSAVADGLRMLITQLVPALEPVQE